MSCGSALGLRTSSGISQCTMWLLRWIHTHVMLCQNFMHSPAVTPTVQCSESARRHYVGVTCIRQVCHSWAKTLHSVKILYWHAKFKCAICIQRTIWLAAKQMKLGTGSSVRRGRGTRNYLQCQTASVSIQNKLTFNPLSGGRHSMSGRTWQNPKTVAEAPQTVFYDQFWWRRSQHHVGWSSLRRVTARGHPVIRWITHAGHITLHAQRPVLAWQMNTAKLQRQ